MKKTIWKFPLEIKDNQTILMPKGAEILTVQTQRTTPCIWALVDPKARTEKVPIQIIGTGHEIEDISRKYIGTFQIIGGDLVFHVFELI